MRVTESVRQLAVRKAVKRHRIEYGARKRQWLLDMKDYRRTFRQTILFRANVDHFLVGIGQLTTSLSAR